jgi:FAD:protein FMN transferase
MSTRRNVILGFAGLAVAGLAGSARAVTVTRPGTAFGTTVSITVTAANETAGNAAIDAGFDEIRAVHRAADLFSADSEITRLNAGGRLGHASQTFHDLVRMADDIFTISAGAFDATVQPLWKLWAEHNGNAPSSVAMDLALRKVNWRKLRRDGAGFQLDDGSALTFNGLAQGYAADRVMLVLRAHGVSSARVDTGETALLETDAGLPIRHPRKASALGTLHMDTGFVAVSGDYASAFSDDFRFHHIIDPQLGFSPRELASVAVVAPTGAMADGLATAFMVMGREKSIASLERLHGCDALFLGKDGDMALSPGMRALFKTPAA